MQRTLSPPAVPSLEDLFCSALRREQPAWAAENDAGALLEQANFHGVGVLLHSQGATHNWPKELAQSLHSYTLQRAMWELRHQHILNETLSALHAQGIEPVLFKGTALAYWLYDEPALRTRGDTDLVVRSTEKHRTHDALIALGYEQGAAVSGEFVSYQASYTKRAPEGSAHTLDVHWKINNSEILSRLFTYDELRAASITLPKLGPHALGLPAVSSLALACMHRATHKVNPYYANGEAHHTADRLIWLYDIHLLANRMQRRQWDEFMGVAQAKGLRAVCLDGIKGAQQRFRTSVPEDVLATLGQSGTREQPDRYLDSGHLQQQWMDFVALETMTDRCRFIGELVFPAPTYMRAKYPESPLGWLPWLYIRRGAAGVLKSLRRRWSAP